MTDHNPPQQPHQHPQPWPPQTPQQPYPPQQYPPAPPAPQQPLQAAPPAKKKRGPLLGVLALAVLAVCCGGVVAAVNSGGGDKAASSASSAAAGGGQAEPAAEPVATKAKPAAPPAPAKPRVLLTVKGSGIKNTAKFTTGDEWQLKYSFDCSNFGYKGNFQVYDYTSGGDLAGILTNELAKKGADTVPVYTAGRHYLTVNTECKWSITVLG